MPKPLSKDARHRVAEALRRDNSARLLEIVVVMAPIMVGLLLAGRGSGNGRGLVIGHQDAGVRIDETQSVASDGGTQRVRVLEGTEAFIQSGQSVPVTDERVIVSSTGVTTVQTSTGFRNVVSGFNVRARLNGDGHVTVEIFPRHNRLNTGSGVIDVREASTVISGRLGRWMEIGRVDSTSSESTRGIGASSSTTSSNDYVTYLKVQRLDR